MHYVGGRRLPRKVTGVDVSSCLSLQTAIDSLLLDIHYLLLSIVISSGPWGCHKYTPRHPQYPLELGSRWVPPPAWQLGRGCGRRAAVRWRHSAVVQHGFTTCVENGNLFIWEATRTGFCGCRCFFFFFRKAANIILLMVLSLLYMVIRRWRGCRCCTW